jgi:hypothetical protein
MPIALIDKAVAALAALDLDSIQSVPPAERRRLVDICRHVASVAEPRPAAPKPTEPKAAVLYDLYNGVRQE